MTEMFADMLRREFGLERFVPCGLLDSMKRKELRRLVAHFLKLNAQMTGSQRQLTQLQAKLHYLDIVSLLPSYGAKCFSSSRPERVLLVSPRLGLSQIVGVPDSPVRPLSPASPLTTLAMSLAFRTTYWLMR
ncbi:FERM and PDZ domain-containing protein 4 [Eumeta japonica]|uniref:FERM and PDZ domain-containing protein 4 n=1 Tax=Eumeta variegata TaxID=151549 RepID=A0A4C1VN93_EUMVA|nr:FERM and PDZ domain-containing protein 4 [Eumeta japonica]